MEKEVAFLALTIATELPVAMFVFGKRDWRRVILAVVCVNLITHPVAWHLAGSGVSIFTLEIGVAMIEATLLTLTLHPLHLPLGRGRVFGAGVAMNVVSAVIGVTLF